MCIIVHPDTSSCLSMRMWEPFITTSGDSAQPVAPVDLHHIRNDQIPSYRYRSRSSFTYSR